MANRLRAEPSPYLQQHADNPVDWFPWGPEALSEAAERDVPILLSIGYSSCHWCHVMAHESFEDAATAAYMNEHFVCIKVDREERPDIDAIYLEAAQAMSGHGGWPLTAFLTPAQVPFFAGTYFPPQPRPNMPSFRQLMESIVDVWTNHRDRVVERSDLVAQQLVASARLAAPDEPVDPAVLDAAVGALRSNFDHENGGFGLAPKFPPHSVTEFLLGRADGDGRELALTTLRAIAAGGIHDHVAGGFARYSVDAHWRVPHFEKMLYDNALLARSFLHALRATGDDAFAETARSTLDWMLEDLRGEDGGFSSALDADSVDADGTLTEGAFYTWSAAELRDVVGQAAGDEAEALLTYWGISEHGVLEGKNVLAVVAPEAKPTDAAIIAARGALKTLRAARPSPAIDDKRIATWNALAVSALAEAGAVLREPRYTSAALDCAGFIERELSLDGGRLRRSSTRGTPGPAGFLEDHAFVAAAYLTLHEVTSDEKWFLRAREIADAVIEQFEDAEHGGFFSVAGDQEQLIVRRKDIEDNPIPSSNSAAALMLLRIAALTGEQRYRASATRALQVVAGIAGRLPLGFGHVLEAIAFHAGPVDEVALVGPPDQREVLLEVVLGDFRPRLVIAAGVGGGDSAVPLLADRPALDGQAAAYVCHDFTCGLPATDPQTLAEQLSAGTP